MIHLITSRPLSYDKEALFEAGMKFAKGKDFLEWLDGYTDRTQLDTETNVVRDVFGWVRKRKGKTKWHLPTLDSEGNKTPIERECYVVQIGDEEGVDQWLFDIPGLSGKKLEALKVYLRSDLVKILHNALFDYTVIKWNFGIDIKNIRCTYLMSRILHMGRTMESGWHSFLGCCERYLGIYLSKEAQTTFNGEPMTLEQLKYAAIDVAPLAKLHDAMEKDITFWGLENVVRLESALVRPYGDAMCENFYLDVDQWLKNMHAQEINLAQIIKNIHKLIKEYFHQECIDLKFIQDVDHYHFMWNSPKKKKALIRIPYPNLPNDCTTLPKYKKYLKELLNDLDKGLEREDPTILELYLARNFDEMEKIFVSKYHNELNELGIFTPKGTILINLNSPEQTTALFQLIKPEIENSNKDTLAKIKHPLTDEFKKFSKAAKMVTSYGENFIDTVAPDGMLRIPKITQILETGRTSLGLFQLLPGDNKYRNCFYPPEGWKVIGVDYSSQEGCVAATVCQEPQLLAIFEKGYDFHSYCASLLFPDEWAKLGGDPEPKGKPKDKQLLNFRGMTKKTSFGLFYGKSAVGLANDLDLFIGVENLIAHYEDDANAYIMLINTEEEIIYTDHYKQFCDERYNGRYHTKLSRRMYLKEEHKAGRWKEDIVTADDLIERFFNVFPKVKEILSGGADIAIQKCHIRTPDVFGRIRFFENPDDTGEERAIHRQAMNFPIQSISANMTKYAIVLCKKYIDEHDLQDTVKFFLPIHDEAIFIAKEEFAEEWLKIQTKLMEKAGELVLGHTLQKAEGCVSDYWQK